MQPKERTRWEKARQRGMLAYVLVYGLVFYGVPMFLVMGFAFRHSPLPLWQTALIWLAAGALYGIVTWLVQERRYRKAVASHPA